MNRRLYWCGGLWYSFHVKDIWCPEMFHVRDGVLKLKNSISYTITYVHVSFINHRGWARSFFTNNSECPMKRCGLENKFVSKHVRVDYAKQWDTSYAWISYLEVTKHHNKASSKTDIWFCKCCYIVHVLDNNIGQKLFCIAN